ncbi:HK97 gp10 family phage protein [Cronobacter dublinensis]|nr:HK97 gp10 family phage protein [Cronobacter dublinensis]
MSENASFMASINAFVDRAKANQETVVRVASLRILVRLVQMSPVDTGRFRGNWLVGFNNVPDGTLATVDKTGSETIARGSLVIEQFKVGMTSVYFTNNLPYALSLELGHSSQAPAGMVRVTAAEFQRFFDAAAQEVRT